MAAPTVVPVTVKVYKEFAVTFGGSDYAPAVASCKFTPNQPSQTWRGGTPAANFTDFGAATWTCQMKVGQDWDNAASLARYLLAHAGETVVTRFTPIKGGTTFEVSLVLAAPEIGGDIDAFGDTTVTHGVNGQPTIVAA